MRCTGYDAHWADPLAGLQFEARTYHMLCQQTAALAVELCQGRCMWIMEGGYHVQSLSEAVATSLSAILTKPRSRSAGQTEVKLREEPLTKVQALLDQVVQSHALK